MQGSSQQAAEAHAQAESAQVARQPGPGASAAAPAGAASGAAPALAAGSAQANGAQPESAEEQRKREDALVAAAQARSSACHSASRRRVFCVSREGAPVPQPDARLDLHARDLSCSVCAPCPSLVISVTHSLCERHGYSDKHRCCGSYLGPGRCLGVSGKLYLGACLVKTRNTCLAMAPLRSCRARRGLSRRAACGAGGACHARDALAGV